MLVPLIMVSLDQAVEVEKKIGSGDCSLRPESSGASGMMMVRESIDDSRCNLSPIVAPQFR